MRYAGCKRRLLPFIHNTIQQHNIQANTFCDLFAGTATVGSYFKQHGYQVVSNDFLYHSYIQQYVKIKLNHVPTFFTLAQHLNLTMNLGCHYAPTILAYLNQLPGQPGFIYQHYSPGGTKNSEHTRLYYTDDNAQKIDAIRETIEQWYQQQLLTDDEYYYLLYALLVECSAKASTTGVMRSFLKHFKDVCHKPIELKAPPITPSNVEHAVYCQDATQLVHQLSHVDLLYLDPPYTRYQYATDYHLLETIARWDNPAIYGVTGRRKLNHLRSPFSSKMYAEHALQELIKHAHFNHLLLSYSNDGLMSHQTIMAILSAYGHASIHTQPLKRFKSNTHQQPTKVEERLYYLKPWDHNEIKPHHPTPHNFVSTLNSITFAENSPQFSLF